MLKQNPKSHIVKIIKVVNGNDLEHKSLLIPH